MVSDALLSGTELFAGLSATELDDFLRTFVPARFPAGHALMRQGSPAESAFLLEHGEVEVLTHLPGGGTVAVTTLGPGSMIGEMALLDSGTHAATVAATVPVRGFFMPRDDFRLLLHRMNAAALKVQHRLALMLCARLRRLNARVLAVHVRDHAPAPPLAAASELPPEPAAPAFDWRAFLPALPAFHGFLPEDIDAVISGARALVVPRGTRLFREGDPTTACFVVVRGAIEVSANSPAGPHRLGILGPGTLCGHMGLIDGVAHGATAVAREDAVLLEFGRARFEQLYAGTGRLAVKCQNVVIGNLLQSLARTNNHLTRLISIERIHGAGAASDLELALYAQAVLPASTEAQSR